MAEDSLDMGLVLSHTMNGPIFANLTNLSLIGIDVAQYSSEAMCKNLNIPALCSLGMFRCNYMFHFLDGFAQALTETPGRLESLEIQLPENLVQPAVTIETIERFLKACPSLSALTWTTA
jgi:hypothetical protein